MAGFSVDLKKFKKVAEDKDTTTMQHMQDGHKIIVAKKALPKHIQDSFSKLPMADSGSDDEHKEKNHSKRHGAFTITAMSHHMGSGGMMARGGQVKRQSNPKLEQSKVQGNSGFTPRMANGRKVSDDEIIAKKAAIDKQNDENQAAGVDLKEYPPEVEKRMKETDVTPRQFADGGDTSTSDSVDSNIDNSISSGDTTPQDDSVLSGGQSDSVSNDAQQPMQPMTLAQPEPAQPVQNQMPNTSGTPGLEQGYQNQIGGIKGEALEQAKQSAQEQPVLDAAAKNQEQLFNQYQQKSTELLNERASLQKAIQDSQIKPNQLFDNMNTFQRIQTGIGLFLGGLGAGITHTSNDALDFLNKQIDRDIESQQANLGKKQSLLAANSASIGDLKDATMMTKMMMQDHVVSQLQAAAAQSNSAIVQQRAKEAIGKIQMEQAPMFQQLAMRQSLLGSPNGLPNQPNQLMSSQPGQPQQFRKEDPASYVPYIVPSDKQAEVTKEIQQAQNAAKIKDQYMQMFDQAKGENTVGNRIAHLGFAPASILGMRALMLPLIHDAEGRVNEFEQKTTSDLEPQPGDSDAKIAQKRNATLQFLNQKSSAPMAKAYGIDLNKFSSTSQNPEARLNPQQQSFLTWARQNPSNSKAQAIFKKLGVSQ